MRALIQRVSQASVTTDSEQLGSIERGYLILLGIGKQDSKKNAKALWNKIVGLRLFEDKNGKTNLSLGDVRGSVLLVSQFTLYADCKKGKRPSFSKAAAPDTAEELYEYFAECIRQDKMPVQTGCFGATMRVSLVNDGPFTIWLDSDELDNSRQNVKRNTAN